MLRHLGIDDVTLRAARTVTSKAQLEAFGSLMPEDQFEALWLLADGLDPNDIYRELVAVRQKVPEAADDTAGEYLATAVTRTRSRIALVTGADELADILAKPFAAWRIFLHPTQRRIAYRPAYAGPAQITGEPDTGKTVVALHRVKHLLDRAPDTRILLTTYTNALARSLHSSLALLLDHDEELLARVDVTTVDAVAHRTVRQLRGNPGGALGDKDERTRWQRLLRRLDLPGNEAFLSQEYRHVILARTCAARRNTSRASGADAAARSGGPSGDGSGRPSPSSRRSWRAPGHTPGSSSAPRRPGCCGTNPMRDRHTTTSSSTRHRTCTRRSGGCCARWSRKAPTTCSSPATPTSGSTTPGSPCAL